MSSKYPAQYDVVWIGSDAAGKVAAFVSAGEGPVPVSMFEAIDFIEEEILKLPAMSEAILVEGAPTAESFTELCRRGLFVYDWSDVHGPPRTSKYQKMAAPRTCIEIAHLPVALRAFAKACVLPGADFLNDRSLDVTVSLECESG
jgi:hypothetical protein